jgi:surface antigen
MRAVQSTGTIQIRNGNFSGENEAQYRTAAKSE